MMIQVWALSQSMKRKLAGARKSLTIWFNGVMGSFVVVLPFALDGLPQLQPHIPDNVYHKLMAVVVLGNLILRFRTSTALEHKC